MERGIWEIVFICGNEVVGVYIDLGEVVEWNNKSF